MLRYQNVYGLYVTCIINSLLNERVVHDFTFTLNLITARGLLSKNS